MITNEVEYLFMFTGHSGLLFAFSYLLLIFYWISIFPSALFFLICRKLKKKKKSLDTNTLLQHCKYFLYYSLIFLFNFCVCVCAKAAPPSYTPSLFLNYNIHTEKNTNHKYTVQGEHTQLTTTQIKEQSVTSP